MFMDSDDVLMDGAIEELLCTAKALRADIVQGGFVSFDSDSGKTVGITRYTNSDHIPPNGTLAGMPWGKVYRSRLFEEVCFPLGYIHQDTIITGIITHLAENIASTSEMVCRYRIHRKSITNTVRTSPKAVHTLWVNLCVLQARTELCLKTDVDFYLHLLRQVVLSQNRLRLQPRSIQYSAFVIMREMLSIQRKGLILDSMDTKYKKLEEAILNRNYMKYLVLCGMW